MSTWEHDDRMRDAYDPDNPKHPDWEDLAADRADMERKRLKEEGPDADTLQPTEMGERRANGPAPTPKG